MSNYKLEFTLKQHTPMIHFQATESGATLRASELKPKLDRFLIKEVFGGKESKENFEKYLIDKDKWAFDYKVKIEIDDKIGDIKFPNQTLFFANMGKYNDNEKVKQKFDNKTEISVIFHSFHDELIVKIKEIFPNFIANTNFGTRQSKGFGSFYLDKKSNYYKPIEQVLRANIYFLQLDKVEHEKVEEVIKYFWNRFKSGINLNYNNQCNKPYESAFSKKYFYEDKDNITWDKRWIKETFFGLSTKSPDPKFVRALFGLSSSYTYKVTKEPCNKDKNLNIEDNYKIELYNSDISRIKSPLTFKPIVEGNQVNIYIIINENIIIPNNKKFEFIKKFDYKKSDYKKYGKTKYKSVLIPEYDPNKKPKPIKGSKEQDIKKFIDITNQNNNVNFNYKAQNQRFQKFLDEFCELKDGLWCPKKFPLLLPDNFDISSILNEYVEHLTSNFKVEYIQGGSTCTIDVAINKIGGQE